MNENRFAAGGWACIASAVLLPLSYVVAGIEMSSCDLEEFEFTVGLSVSDFLFLVLGAVTIYVFLALKKMLYERYSFRGLNLVITLSILWTIINYGGSFVMQLIFTILTSGDAAGPVLISTIYWIVGVAGFGLLDIAMGIIMMMQLSRFSVPLRAFAILTLISGVLEATFILSFLVLILNPIGYVVLAYEFFRPEESVEFV